MHNTKEVMYSDYCKICKNRQLPPNEDPCNECLTQPFNYDSRKPIKFKSNGMIENDTYYTKFRRVKEYLYELKYDFIDYADAIRYFTDLNTDIGGFCSSVHKGNFYGRNFDWTYDNRAEFVVKVPRIFNRYSSIGVCGGFSELTDEFVRSKAKSELYKYLPFRVFDGINEHGVIASTNVVPKLSDIEISTPLVSPSIKIPALMLVRFILDNFSTAIDAIHHIVKHVTVIFPKSTYELGYELHWMIADENSTYILEYVDGVAKVTNKDYMTNFHINDVIFNSDGKVYTPETNTTEVNPVKTNHIYPYASGLERWNIIVDSYDRLNTKNDFKTLMNNLIYSKAYSTYKDPANPFWYSEFVYEPNNVSLANDISDFEPIVQYAGGLYENRSRTSTDESTWQTVHSSIYDISKRRLYLTTQEDDKEFVFKL